MTTKQAAWIGFWGLVIAAIIGAVALMIVSYRQKPQPIMLSISQKAGRPDTNKAAGADYMEAQHD